MSCYLLLATLFSVFFGAVFQTIDCPNYNNETWFSATATDCYTSKVYTANLTNKDYCYNEITFVLHSHVTLANPSAPRKIDSVGDTTLGNKNCGVDNTDIDYCVSHCMDKNIENAFVNASMSISQNWYSIWYAAQDNLKALGKGDWPLLMIEPFQTHSVIDFQYYDDMNYCFVDILYILPAGDYYPAWPFRTTFITHKTTPLA